MRRPAPRSRPWADRTGARGASAKSSLRRICLPWPPRTFIDAGSAPRLPRPDGRGRGCGSRGCAPSRPGRPCTRCRRADSSPRRNTSSARVGRAGDLEIERAARIVGGHAQHRRGLARPFVAERAVERGRAVDAAQAVEVRPRRAPAWRGRPARARPAGPRRAPAPGRARPPPPAAATPAFAPSAARASPRSDSGYSRRTIRRRRRRRSRPSPPAARAG